MNSMDVQFKNQGSHHATGCGPYGPTGCGPDHATGYASSSFLTPRSTMTQLSSPIWSAPSCSPIPSGMTPSTSNTAFHSGEASGQNMTRQSSIQYNSSNSGKSPVQLGNQHRLSVDKTDISRPINHVTHGVSRVTQCDTRTTSDAYSMLSSGESIHHGSMHHGSMHQGSMHQGSMHQGSMHQGSMHQGSMHQGSMHQGSMHHGSMHHGSMHQGSTHHGSMRQGSIQQGSIHHRVRSYDPRGSDQWNYIRQTSLQAPLDQHQQPATPSLQEFDQQQQPIQISMNAYHPHLQRSSHQLPSCRYQLPSCQYQQPLFQFPSDQHLQPSVQPSDGFNQLQSNHLFSPTSFSKHVGPAGASFSTSNGAPRTFSEQQTRHLANEYRKENKYLTPASRKRIAEAVGLSEVQVVEWFKRQRRNERKAASTRYTAFN